MSELRAAQALLLAQQHLVAQQETDIRELKDQVQTLHQLLTWPKPCVYYRADCPHSRHLLARLFQHPALASQFTLINVSLVRSQQKPLIGVPTLFDEAGRSFLGYAALDWVEAHAAP